MTRSKDKIRTSEDLARLRSELRAQGKTVVQCHGCFDIVHPGHIRYLQFARGLGDVLVVSVSADSVVGKGDGRPYIGEDLRLENLAAFEFVDFVCLDDNTWAGPVLEAIRPDIYVKGKEYETKDDPRFAKEVEVVEGYGGRIVFSSGDVVYSSSYILSQFKERFPLERERLAAFCKRHALDDPALSAVLRSIVGKRVLVIGDPILDRYIHCEALGVASEQPMLSVTPIREDMYIGAGALIACQMAELGAEVGFITTLPEDADGERFRDAARNRGIELFEAGDRSRSVAVKTRYLVDEQKVFKVDSGRHMPPSTQATRKLVELVEAQAPAFDAMVVTDFGYGMFTHDLIEVICRAAREHQKPYYLDVSHTRRASILQFRGPRIATPTEHELRFAFADNEAGLSHLASRFFAETGAEHLALTMGKRGVLLFDRPARPRAQHLSTEFVPALEMMAVDPVGAGDVFLAGLTLADVAGAPMTHGVYLGSALAGLHVLHLGNDPVSSATLHRYLRDRQEIVR